MLYILFLILPFYYLPLHWYCMVNFFWGAGTHILFCVFTNIMRGRPVPAENDSRIACVENTEE
jgi:hypothetical protein